MKKPENKNLPVKWDEEMAREAEIAAAMENSTATGQFFNLRAGQLTWNGAPIPNNRMAVIILDSILENVYYPDKFDAELPQAPLCFAFGRDDKEMAPHKIVVEAETQQCDACQDCKWNEWASADQGRGKACHNTRRLAMISAGNMDANGKFQAFEADDLKSGPMGFMKLPVTSVKGYAGYVKQLAGTVHRPPHGVVTKVYVVPDAKTQFKVVFEAVNILPTECLGIIRARHLEAISLIDFPYTPFEEPAAKPAPQATARNRQAKKKYR